MKPVCQNRECQLERLQNEWASGQTFAWNLECENCIQSILEMEDTLFRILKQETEFQLLGMDSNLSETLDVRKAELRLSKNTLEVPNFLKSYVSQNLQSPKQKDSPSILVLLQETGVQLLQIFQNQSIFTHKHVLHSAIRSKESKQSLMVQEVEEQRTDSSDFTYLMVPESANDIFLSVKIHSKISDQFKQVHLSKDDRFLLSSKVDQQGVVSFSRLKEGNYHLEFVGSGIKKSIDVTVLVP